MLRFSAETIPNPTGLPGDDLAGHVMAQEDWDVVRLRAIA
jgi:hypothetical protein